jgi:hypothetical protein
VIALEACCAGEKEKRKNYISSQPIGRDETRNQHIDALGLRGTGHENPKKHEP